MIGSNTPFIQFMRGASRHFALPLTLSFSLVGANFTDGTVRNKYMEGMSNLAQLPLMHPFMVNHNWLSDMLSWIVFDSAHGHTFRNNEHTIPDDHFVSWISEYLNSSIGLQHASDVHRNEVGEVTYCTAPAMVIGVHLRISALSDALATIEDVLTESTGGLDFKVVVPAVAQLIGLFAKLSSRATYAAVTSVASITVSLILVTHDVKLAVAAGAATAAAASFLRGFMSAAQLQLHPFSFIYTVVVVGLTMEFITYFSIQIWRVQASLKRQHQVAIAQDQCKYRTLDYQPAGHTPSTLSRAASPQVAVPPPPLTHQRNVEAVALIQIGPLVFHGALTTAASIAALSLSHVPVVSETFCHLGILTVAVALFSATVTFPAVHDVLSRFTRL
jgi:hypothetical protein